MVLITLNTAVLISYVARDGVDQQRFWLTLAVTVLLLACPVLLRVTAKIELALQLVVVPCMAAAFVLASGAGGLQAPTSLLLILTPMLVNLIFGDRLGKQVLVLALLCLIGLAVHMGPRPEHLASARPAVVVHLLSCMFTTVLTYEVVRRYRIRDRMLQQKIERQERLAGIGTLAAGVAHEIRNPLAVIVLNVELLREELSAEEDCELADDVLAASEQIRFIVQQLGYTPSHELPPSTVVPLLELLQTACLHVRARFSLTPEIQLTISSGVTIVGVRRSLLQVFTNLLVNALHALESVSDGLITVHYRASGSWDIITVDDNGPGFPEDLLVRLSEPFVTTRAEQGGSGLGLFIVESRIREVGGALKLGSSPTSGARAEVFLPRARSRTA
ncbi:MAG: HAMP domain-containing sensor histidine kinase [Myxococcota bacterium]|nr:HAMP domain-containing sensor histidine kinase [Myxococcota bacterium]